MENAKVNSIADLRKKTASEIQELGNSKGVGRFGTTQDGYILPTNLLQHFENEAHNDVPLLTGWVTGDGGLMGNAAITAEKFEKDAKTNYAEKAEEFLKIFAVKTDEEAKVAQGKLGLLQFAGLSSHLWAGFNKKHKTYIYQFSHVPPDKPNFPNYGAFHTAEVPYALHTLKKWNRPWMQTDLDLENLMSTYWVNFAKTGNPNGKNLTEWKAYGKTTGNILEFGDKVVLKENLFKKELDFLEMAKK